MCCLKVNAVLLVIGPLEPAVTALVESSGSTSEVCSRKSPQWDMPQLDIGYVPIIGSDDYTHMLEVNPMGMGCVHRERAVGTKHEVFMDSGKLTVEGSKRSPTA